MTLKYIVQFAAFGLLLLLETYFPLFKGWKKRWRHIGRNISIVVINNMVYFALFSFVTTFIFRSINEKQIGILNILPLKGLLRVALIIVLFDLWMYIWHRLVHRVSFLWRFHRMHHSDLNMDASTALRFHPGEIVASTLFRWGVFSLIGMRVGELLLYETIMLPVIFFHHSNFYLPERLDRVLRRIIITPWIHWVHHSQIYEESNSNYGTIFSWWDRFFATFRLRKDPSAIQYGLDQIADPIWQTIPGMMKTPFVNKF